MAPRGGVLFFGRGTLQFELRAVKTPANGRVIQGDGSKTDQRNLSRSFRTLTIQKSSIIRATQHVGKVQKSRGWLGNVLFRIATIIAVLIAVWVLWEFLYESERGQPIIRYQVLLIAGIILLVGWVCRQMLAGPRDDSNKWKRLGYVDRASLLLPALRRKPVAFLVKPTRYQKIVLTAEWFRTH
jgi:hypothetical protein